MAHELEIFEDGIASMAYAGDVPWHNLGQRVSNDLTPQEIRIAAKCNWTALKVNNFARFVKKVTNDDGTVGESVEYLDTGKKTIIRDIDGAILSPSVGENWEVIDNLECFEFFSEFVKSGHMEMHTAGSLMGGQIIWALARIKKGFSLFGGKDYVDGYLLFSVSHRYGKVSFIDFTPIRVVCANTLQMALDGFSANGLRITHREKFDPEVAKMMLGIASGMLDKHKEQSELLSQKNFTGAAVGEYVRELFPVGGAKKGSAELSRSAGRVLELLDTQPGSEFGPGTWWSAYNAVTYMVDHELSRDKDRRMFNAWLGSTRKTKITAFQNAVAYAAA